MRRFGLLLAGGALWLFLAAIPALADGGPHLSLVNSGSSSLTADSCAGCHRAHTAQGEYLLIARSEEALCLSCHGAAGTGSTIDVEFGIQYVPAMTGLAGGLTTTAGRASVVTYTVTAVSSGPPNVLTVSPAAGSAFVAGQAVEIAGLGGIRDGVYEVAATPLPTTTTFALAGYNPTYLGGATVKVTDYTAGGVILGATRDGGFLRARIDASNPTRAMYPRGWENAPINTEFAISTRPKVSVGTSEPVTSAHVDLIDAAGNGIADGKTVWGKGIVGSGVGTLSVTLECVDCHNPHGNGNYRILRPVPGIESDPLGTPDAVTIKAAFASSPGSGVTAPVGQIVTDGQHSLAVGDTVKISGLTWATNNVTKVAATTGVFTVASNHGLAVGSTIVIAGSITGYPAGTYTVATVPTFRTFTLTTGTPQVSDQTWTSAWPTVTAQNGPMTVTAVTNGFTFHTGPVANNPAPTASVIRPQVAIADVPVDPDGNPANGIENPVKNYTILQTKGLQGTNSTFLLYARDVINARNNFGVAANQPPVTITSVEGGTASDITAVSGNLFTDSGTPTPGATGHGFSVNQWIYISGVTGVTNGWYQIDTVPSSTTFTVAGVTGTAVSGALATPAGTFVTNTGGTNGHGLAVGDVITLTPSATWTGVQVTLDPATGATQSSAPWTASAPFTATVASVAAGTNSAPQAYYDRFTIVGIYLDAGGGGNVVRKGLNATNFPGNTFNYSATGGDYFRRTVPWNPALTNPNCSLTIFTSDNSLYCSTMFDAPNGRPAAITSGPTALVGQQAFVDQMSTWCAQCHSRYYSASNENVGNLDPITDLSNIAIGRILSSSSQGQIFPVVYSGTSYNVNGQQPGPSYGDKVTFTNSGSATLDANPAGGWLVVQTGTTGGRSWFKVTASANGLGGTPVNVTSAGTAPFNTPLGTGGFTRTYQYSNSSWGFPRAGESLFKYQHSTSSNRACTVCHVAHGSNATMTGQNGTTFSANVPYPDGTIPAGPSSRLLKIDNRGTCEMCHDPTGTTKEGEVYPASGTGFTYRLNVP